MKRCKFCGFIKVLNKDSALFLVPKDIDKFNKWVTSTGAVLKQNDFICMKHFKKRFVREFQNENGKITRRTLTADAVPTLYLGSMSSSSSVHQCSPENSKIPVLSIPSKVYCSTKKSYSLPDPEIPEKVKDTPPQSFQFSSTPSISQQNLDVLNTNNSPLTIETCVSRQPNILNFLKEIVGELYTLLPSEWGIHKSSTSIVVSHVQGTIPKIDRAIVVDENGIKVYLNAVYYNTYTLTTTTLENFVNLIQKVQSIRLCGGSGIDGKISPSCSGGVLQVKTSRCRACAVLRRKLLKKNIKCPPKVDVKKKFSKLYTSLVRKQKMQTKTIESLRSAMRNVQNIDNLISNLPENQKLVVQTCFDTAIRPSRGKRYTKEWIYTCILLKIKSPKLYRHLRTREILPLPAPSTLSNYIRNIDSSYGFQKKLFELLKEKTKNMPEFERHGTLMVDECKISPSKHFDKNQLQVLGFVDLGEHTPNHQKDQLGDHVLIIMFQSFAGKNMQTLACFLSKGNVVGTILAKLILEAILLCEAAGLFIDVVTADGATWNRAMWKAFNAGNPERPWCAHPCNTERKLRMCSDFLHLIKCMRNRLVEKKEFHVPEGVVQLRHFEKLIEYDAKNEFKLAYKLTRKHVNPENHEKMRTKYAFQLFSGTVADALTILKEKGIPEFADCEPTIQFCRRINELSDILNSNNCFNGLKPNSAEQRALEDFLIYLDLWQSCAHPEFFLTKSTSEGLKATINTTLDLLKYCTQDLGYKYLMTSRINQDPLEHFFGLMRANGGVNNNPESIQIAQIFRLMSLYSLIKPPKGSNVSGGNMLDALIGNSRDLLHYNSADNKKITKKDIDLKLDQALEEDVTYGASVHFSDNNEAFAYVCGSIARRHKTEPCQSCVQTIVGDGLETFNAFITLRSRGHLTFPSVGLVNLLQEVESTIAENLRQDLRRHTLIEILDSIGRKRIHHLVGCEEHKSEMTKKVLFSFLITRLSFSCQKEARKRSSEHTNSKKFSKLSKLV